MERLDRSDGVFSGAFDQMPEGGHGVRYKSRWPFFRKASARYGRASSASRLASVVEVARKGIPMHYAVAKEGYRALSEKRNPQWQGR